MVNYSAPSLAIFETVSLAIYDDRVEIVNPGAFPMMLNPKNIKLPHESYPRNLSIAQVLYKTTYLESWGSGVSRMINACKKQNAPEPYYKQDEMTTTIVFERPDEGQNEGQSEGQNELTARAKRIISLIKANKQISIREIALKLSLSESTIYREMKKINKTTPLYWEGAAKKGKWVIGMNEGQSEGQNEGQNDS